MRDPKTGELFYKPLPRLKVVQELDRLGRCLLQQQPPLPVRWQRIAPTHAALINLAASEPMLVHITPDTAMC